MEPPIAKAKPTEHSHLPGPSSPPALPPSAPLARMLELLREQEEERQVTAVSLAQSLLRTCGSAGGAGKRAREIAQATAHEALRCAKANSGNKSGASAHHQGSASLFEDPLVGKGDLLRLHSLPSCCRKYSCKCVRRASSTSGFPKPVRSIAWDIVHQTDSRCASSSRNIREGRLFQPHLFVADAACNRHTDSYLV